MLNMKHPEGPRHESELLHKVLALLRMCYTDHGMSSLYRTVPRTVRKWTVTRRLNLLKLTVNEVTGQVSDLIVDQGWPKAVLLNQLT